MKTYFVDYEEPCEMCAQAGVETHWEWELYWKETGGYRGLSTEEQMAADEKWWSDRGYSSSRNWPPEEVACSNCDGAGVLRGRVSLVDALADIGWIHDSRPFSEITQELTLKYTPLLARLESAGRGDE